MRCPLQNKKVHGREWAVEKLAGYLESRAVPTPESRVPGVLVVGGPGSGKTALCCEVLWPTSPTRALLKDRVLAHHFCQRFHKDSLQAHQLVSDLARQLLASTHIPAFSLTVGADARLAGLVTPAGVRADPRRSLIEGILQPLAALPPPPRPLLLLLDSLHEATEAGEPDGRSLLDMVGLLASKLPPWVLLVATSRRSCAAVARQVVGFRKLALDDLRRSAVVKDVQQYILARLDSEEGLKAQLDSETAEMLNQLHIKSAGCLLYLEMVLDGVREGFLRLREVQHMPCTLNGFYLWLCQRIFSRSASFEAARLVLDVMLAARTPLRLPEVLQITVCRRPTLEHAALVSILQSLNQIVLEFKAHQPASQDKFLLIIHASFTEWLLDVKHCTRKYLCDPREGHAALALWYASQGPKLHPGQVPRLAYHLAHSAKLLFQDPGLAPAFLVQCGAPVGQLVLTEPAFDDKTTQLLVGAGADFSAAPAVKDVTDGAEKEGGREGKSPGGGSETSGTTRSENEVCVDESGLDGEGRTALHAAAADGRAETVRRMLAKGAYCDAEDSRGETPLCTAARLGHCTVLRHLLDAGADLEKPGADGWTALRCAAWGGHLEALDLLLSAGAEVDGKGTEERTALRAAAWGGHEEVVKHLLAAGAKTEKSDREGRVPLMAAAYMGHADVVTLLLSSGAEANQADKEGCTALAVAAVCSSQGGGHLEVAHLLLEGGADPDLQDRYGRTPLFLAAMEGHREMCRLLVERGAEVELADVEGNTPLLAATACGALGAVEELLECGAAADAIDKEGRTALSVAAMQGSVKLVEILLRQGLDEMHRDNAGWLPLHHAAAEGHTEASDALCQRNVAVVEETDHEGRHALFLAAEEGHLETLALLLRLGSPMDLQTAEGQTALRSAASAGRIAVCRSLWKAGADLEARDLDGRSILASLVLEQELELAEIFLGFGCRVNSADSHKRTPLYLAAHQNDVAALKVLVKYGADLNSADADGRTPLMAALWQGSLEAARFLVLSGAPLGSVDSEGASALSIAAQQGLEPAIAVLLQQGADAAHKDAYGRSPADVARRAGHSRVANILSAASSAASRPSSAAQTSSGFGSVHMEASLDSAAGLSPLPEDSAGPLSPALRRALRHPGPRHSTNSAGRHSARTDSTLSSCGSPQEDFRGQLLERSLPRPASMRLSCLLPDDFDPLLSVASIPESGFSSTSRRRPGIATNPKVRQNSSSSLLRPPSVTAASSTASERTHSQLRNVASRLSQLDPPASPAPSSPSHSSATNSSPSHSSHTRLVTALLH